MGSSTPHITQLLLQWRAGDPAALSQLTTLLYRELRVMAGQHVRRERKDQTLQGTALVNEAFMRLVNLQSVDIHDRAHFFSLASTIMRRILVDNARSRLSLKRGGNAKRIPSEALDGAQHAEHPQDEPIADMPQGEAMLIDSGTSENIHALDELLSRLEERAPRQTRIVEMRYFGGLTVEQTAEALEISEATVKREWAAARAWLRRELGRMDQ